MIFKSSDLGCTPGELRFSCELTTALGCAACRVSGWGGGGSQASQWLSALLALQSTGSFKEVRDGGGTHVHLWLIYVNV